MAISTYQSWYKARENLQKIFQIAAIKIFNESNDHRSKTYYLDLAAYQQRYFKQQKFFNGKKITHEGHGLLEDLLHDQLQLIQFMFVEKYAQKKWITSIYQRMHQHLQEKACGIQQLHFINARLIYLHHDLSQYFSQCKALRCLKLSTTLLSFTSDFSLPKDIKQEYDPTLWEDKSQQLLYHHLQIIQTLPQLQKLSFEWYRPNFAYLIFKDTLELSKTAIFKTLKALQQTNHPHSRSFVSLQEVWIYQQRYSWPDLQWLNNHFRKDVLNQVLQ